MKYILIAAAALTLAGCNPDDNYNYRYFCQDPANLNSEYCTSSQCEIDRECPHHLSPVKKLKCGDE